jgi:hypothetical protein
LSVVCNAHRPSLCGRLGVVDAEGVGVASALGLHVQCPPFSPLPCPSPTVASGQVDARVVPLAMFIKNW